MFSQSISQRRLCQRNKRDLIIVKLILVNNQISKFLQERIDANDFPSAVYLVAEKGEILFQDALGCAVVEPERIEAKLDTIYDLASLTKVLVTGLLIAILIEQKQIAIENKIVNLIGSVESGRASDATVLQMLTHTSGFQAWKPFYLKVERRSDVLAEILRTPVTEIVNVLYSDLNFLVLGFVAEMAYKSRLDLASFKEISEKLDLRSTWFEDDLDSREIVAASEKGNEFERRTCIEQGYLGPADDRNNFFRSQIIWGEVHDGNAYFMGGVAGHAGLFSTAEEVFKIAQQFLPNYTTLLKPETCELFRTNFTPGLNEDRSFAFQLATTKDSTAGTMMSPESFGHLGFTGTSLWIDPVRERIFILLTNRTHYHSLPFVNINAVRRRFHDLAIDLIEKKS